MLKNFLEDQKFNEGDVNIDRLQIDKCIGRGNSDVYLAESNKTKIAIKLYQIKSDYEYQNFIQQIATLKSLSLSCPEVIKYQGYFVTSCTKTKAYNNRRCGYLLMERADMNLAELIKSKAAQRCRIHLQQISNMIMSLLAGFAYLESKNIAHCDIKPENILYFVQPTPHVKICDVGSCKKVDSSQQNQSTIRGTLSFLAPELIKIQDIKITSINPFRSDVYSLGLVILYLITGKKFNSQERKEVEEIVYFEIVLEWIKMAAQTLSQDYAYIGDLLRKMLQPDMYKRSLFRQLRVMFEGFCRKRKILRDNKMKKMKRIQTQNQSIETRKQSYMSQKTKLPKLKGGTTNSSTLISFHSRQRLTGKISTGNLNKLNSMGGVGVNKKSSQKSQKSKRSNEKSKRSNEKSRSNISPFQKTTMYSTFSIDKSKLSIQLQAESKKIIHITQQNYQLIPYQSINQEQKIFILFSPNVLFQCANAVVIKKSCNVEIFDKISSIKLINSLYLDYQGVQIFGIDENTPTLPNIESVFINLENSLIENGYNNLLRCLCPISVKNIHLQLTGSDISYQEVRQELERLKNKEIAKFDLCWDKASLNSEQFVEINQKIGKLPLKKLLLSLGSVFLKPGQKSRWPLPTKCKILYLNFPNNFLAGIIGSLSNSLASLTQLKQLFINQQNNSLSDTDIKVLIKSLRQLKNLQKAVLNFSFNNITKGIYCFEELKQLNKITSLQLRISKCQINVTQFVEIFGVLAELFNANLKILKITYDRKLSKKELQRSLEAGIKEQLSQTLKLDIIGYDYSHFMIYAKKKTQSQSSNAAPSNKNIRIRPNPHPIKNPGPVSSKTIDSPIPLVASNKTIQLASISQTMRPKQEQDQFPEPNGSVNMNGSGSIASNTSYKYKSAINRTIRNKNNNAQLKTQKTCQALFTSYPTYECYICLGCIESKQKAKYQYYCRSCIQNCEHKGHHIVRTYERKVCNCPFNQKCHFKAENNDLTCAQKLGIDYKREYECLKCAPNASVCQGCILQCEEGHPEWIEKRASTFFQCHSQVFLNGENQNQNSNINTNKQ